MVKTILKTQNEEWGFWSTTLNNYSKKQTQKRWNEVFETLLELSGKPAEDIRDFLDSRSGRHFANQCCGEDNVKRITMECYFGWLEKDLFNDDGKKETQISKVLFGTNVKNNIKGTKSVVLYTYKNPNRINQDYAMCIGMSGEKYRIGMDYITPIEF